MKYIESKITKFFYKDYIIELEISEKEGYKQFAELHITKEMSGIKYFMVGFSIDDALDNGETIEEFVIRYIYNQADIFIEGYEELLEEIDG